MSKQEAAADALLEKIAASAQQLSHTSSVTPKALLYLSQAYAAVAYGDYEVTDTDEA